MNFDLYHSTILLTIAGSRAYGMSTATSDIDIKGVCIPPAEYLLGLEGFEQADSPENFKDERFLELFTEDDRKVINASKLEGSIYDLRKFVKMASGGNPNILDVLFCRDEDVLIWGSSADTKFASNSGFLLRQNRELFVSAKCKFTFSGYAFAQLKRINLHRRWLLKRPDHKPTRAEFGLPESTLIPADQLAAASAMVRKKMDSWELDLSSVPDDGTRIAIEEKVHSMLSEVTSGIYAGVADADDSWEAETRREVDAKWRSATKAIGVDDNLLLVMERERKYTSAKNDWDSFANWESTRNKARSELEAKHGYDTKHGAHLVRLLRMGYEILTTGKVNVWRGDIDAEDLLAIRNGDWSYDNLIAYAADMEVKLNDVYNSKSYVVPHAPDMVPIKELCMKILTRSL